MRKRLLRTLFAHRWLLYWLWMFLGTLSAEVGVDALFRKPVVWAQVLLSSAGSATFLWAVARLARPWHRQHEPQD